MKGALYYFSGTGNTKWAADRFKEKFNFYGVDLELFNIEKVTELQLDGYDFFIIGTPIHAGSGPKIVDDFVKRFPVNNKDTKMKCMIYSTQAALSASAGAAYRKILEPKGYNVMIQTMIQMPNNYYFAFGRDINEESIKKILDSARRKIKDITGDFIQDKKVVESVSGIRAAVGKVIAKSYWRFLPRASRYLSSTDECTKCGVCLKSCPKSNITFENGHAIFHSNCMMCLRCIHQCPVNAITYKGKKILQIQQDIIKSL
jgi:ferredoxin/flavodoxin